MRKPLRIVVLILFAPLGAHPALYAVGPTRPYARLQQVASPLNPGDTVLIDSDVLYAGGITFSRAGTPRNRIVMRGIKVNGIRPVIESGTNAVSFIDAGTCYTLEGFEIRNASVRGIYHQAGDLIVRNVVVHHCTNGLMVSSLAHRRESDRHLRGTICPGRIDSEHHAG